MTPLTCLGCTRSKAQIADLEERLQKALADLAAAEDALYAAEAS